MAQAAGFTCDVCNDFAMAVANGSSVQKPNGWMSVHVSTPKGERESIDVCSNACLAALGKLRWECDNEGMAFSFRQKSGHRKQGNYKGNNDSLVKARAALAAKRASA